MGPLRKDVPPQIYESGTCNGNETVRVKLTGITLGASNGRLVAGWTHDWPQPWSHQWFEGSNPRCADGEVTMTISLDTGYQASVNPDTAVISFAAQSGLSVTFPRSTLRDRIFEDGAARDTLADMVRGEVTGAVSRLLDFQIPHIGAFAVTNLLFPAQQTSHLESVHIPGDLVAFGKLKAPGIAVTPAMATVTTGGTLTFTASQAVTWSVPPGCGKITAGGVYTPPEKIARSKVIVVTATKDKAQAYAAVVVTPAQVQIATIL
jgi:hypothetical protein